MSNKKQSSIQWLENNFVKLEHTIGVHGVFYELLDQAKAMHREEMIEFAHECSVSYRHEIAQKYNETYGGKELF